MCCGNLEVTGLPKKTRMTAAELAEILEPIAYPPIGRPLHIEPRARGTQGGVSDLGEGGEREGGR